jgi:hypothetical protein
MPLMPLMTTRRDFLKGLLATAAFAAPRPETRVVQIALLLPEGTCAHRGALLGFEEAKRTADLLGVALRRTTTAGDVTVGPTAPANEPRTLFLVSGIPKAAPPRPRVFYVTSSPRVRQRQAKGSRVVDWHPDLYRFGAEQLNERFHRRFGQPMDEDAWHGWIAVKIAAELALRASPGTGLLDLLPRLAFDGHKGTQLRFDLEDHHLIQPVYRVDGKGKLVGEVGKG